MQITEWAQAKVNLQLSILGRRADGFHQLETVMQTLQFADCIHLTDQTSGIELACDDVRLTAGSDNLAWQAAALLAQAFPGHGVSMLLQKRIPWQAGLGGGSSDAAAVLRGLNRLWRLRLSLSELAGFAAQLGSDVPFFLSGGTALAAGRGEQITPLAACPELEVGLIVPPFGLSTASVYGHWQPLADSPVTWQALREAMLARDRKQIARSLRNDLEAPAFALRPELAAIKLRLTEAGLPVLLSGSGSCLFTLLLSPGDSSRVVSLVPADFRLIFTRFSPLLAPTTAGEESLHTEI